MLLILNCAPYKNVQCACTMEKDRKSIFIFYLFLSTYRWHSQYDILYVYYRYVVSSRLAEECFRYSWTPRLMLSIVQCLPMRVKQIETTAQNELKLIEFIPSIQSHSSNCYFFYWITDMKTETNTHTQRERMNWARCKLQEQLFPTGVSPVFSVLPLFISPKFNWCFHGGPQLAYLVGWIFGWDESHGNNWMDSGGCSGVVWRGRGVLVSVNMFGRNDPFKFPYSMDHVYVPSWVKTLDSSRGPLPLDHHYDWGQNNV